MHATAELEHEELSEHDLRVDIDEIPLGADTEAMDRLRRLLDIPDRPTKKVAEMALALSLLAMSLVAFMFENPFDSSIALQKAMSTAAAGIGLAAFTRATQRRRSHKFTRVARVLGASAIGLAVYALLVHLR